MITNITLSLKGLPRKMMIISTQMKSTLSKKKLLKKS